MVVAVARGVRLNHRSRCGLSRTHKGHDALASVVGNATQVDQAVTCESIWPGISAALSAPWNPTATAVLLAQLPRHHPPFPQRRLCTTSQLFAPRRTTTRGGRQAHPEGVLAGRRVTRIARAPGGQFQHLPRRLARRQHPVAPTGRYQPAGETEDYHDLP